MSLDKKELKHLVSELKKVFASKTELEALRDVINEDLAEFDPNITHVGNEEPENLDAIWFDNGEGDVDEIVYDNPIINELFECINSLQNQIQQLQADVEYLKINGGGSGGGTRPPDDSDEDNDNENITTNECFMILEDGGMFLLEDGSYLLLETSEKVINDSVLALETGGLFMLENGGYMILENNIESITNSILMTENGGNLLLENSGKILLEK